MAPPRSKRPPPYVPFKETVPTGRRLRMGSMKTSLRTLAAAVLAAGLGYAATYLLPPTYASELSLYFPVSAPPSLLSGVRLSGESDQSAVRNLGGALVSPLVASGTQTAVGILTSKTCLSEVVERLNLNRRWDLSEAKALKRLRGSLSAAVDKNGFLSVEVTGESPALCVEILNALYAHLETRAEELTVNVSRRNREFIEGRVREAEEKADQLQTELVSQLSESDRIGYDRIQEAIGEFRAKIQESKVQEAAAKASLAAAESNLRLYIRESRTMPGALLAMNQVNSSLDMLARDILNRRQALEETLARFTTQSAEYKFAQRSLKALEGFAQKVLDVQDSALDRGITPQFAGAKAELKVLSTRISEYNKLLDAFERQVAVSAAGQAKLERTRKEFDAHMAGLASLKTELELAKIAEARDPSRFEVVDPPTEDPEPVGPRRVLIAGVVFLLALFLQVWPQLARRLRESDA